MAFVGTILQELLKFTKNRRERRVTYGAHMQDATLRKLVRFAKGTEFGKANDFNRLLKTRNIQKYFSQNVPVYDYNKLYKEWWHRTIAGEENITWPTKIKYFALTSGTSESASKRVPVSQQMIRQIRKTSIRQMMSITSLDLKSDFYEKSVLMLGGSTDLKRISAGWEGDLSGITTGTVPVWFNRFYKPGRRISKIRDWNEKLNTIAAEAPKWDIGIVCGIPAWVQIMVERIMERNKLKSIHEIWPNFQIYVHGGVSFAPYEDSFNQLMGRKVNYLDTYLASEGFMAFQTAQTRERGVMQLVLDNGMYFEFVPFNDRNFDAEGAIKENPETLLLHEVKENTDYALLISTCSGAWRYLIGDTIRFKSIENCEIIISGRTKHFLSLCGEHLSVDNMNMAIKKASDDFKINVNEFTVAGIPYEGMFAHKWFIGTDQQVDKEAFKKRLDHYLVELNDDYGTERKHALKDILVEQLPLETFYNFMRSKGKEGGQHKFPRVLKGNLYQEWEKYISHS